MVPPLVSVLFCICFSVVLSVPPQQRPKYDSDYYRYDLVQLQNYLRNADDPDMLADACQLSVSKGYRCETHQVTTTDGYILTMHRIAPKTGSFGGKRVAFLQHGLLASADDWVLNFPSESLGFILADAGYDVWMGNMRGNKYSRNHTTLTTKDHAFWQFSFDEMAKYDLTAMVQYVLGLTGEPNLYYVGHSQGTLIGFIQFSEDPTWAAAKIRQFHALAPIAHMNAITSPLKYIAPLTRTLNVLFGLIGYDEFLPSNSFTQWLASTVCESGSLSFLCTDVVFLVAGYDKNNMNATRLPVYLDHTPAGTSSMDIIHFGQMIYAKKFQKYDYGRTENQKRYGTTTPPEYQASQLGVPTALYWGSDDSLGDPDDVALLAKEIPADKLIGNHAIAACDHLDFVWGLNAAPKIYSVLVGHLSNDRR